MKKKFMQHLLTLAATTLACTAILVVPPNPDLPDPGNDTDNPGIENPENGEGEGEQPGTEPQDDRDIKVGKNA